MADYNPIEWRELARKREQIKREARNVPGKVKLSMIDTLRCIVRDHQAEEIDGVLVDATTANCIINVHDALNDTNRAKLSAMPIVRMARVCWKLVK